MDILIILSFHYYRIFYCKRWASLVAQVVKNAAAAAAKLLQLCLTLCDPMDYTVHGILQARTLEWVANFSWQYLPNPGIEPRSPALQADSLPAEPQGEPKNAGVGSRSLLQGIFPTQELNQGLLHCKRILFS